MGSRCSKAMVVVVLSLGKHAGAGDQRKTSADTMKQILKVYGAGGRRREWTMVMIASGELQGAAGELWCRHPLRQLDGKTAQHHR